MKRFVTVIFFGIIFIILGRIQVLYGASISPAGLGFGVCHWPGTAGLNHRDAVNWFYSGGGAEDWIQIEPQRGQYSFANLDKQLDAHFKKWPETSFWLNIMTAMPPSTPDWAKQDPSLSYIELSAKGKSSTFPIWDPDFQKVFEELQTKVSEYIYSPSFKYRDKLKAIIMMSGGGFGEMITWADCPNGDRCKKYLAAGYTDEAYVDAMVNWLVPLYARLFPDYPLVLQVGGGAYGKVAQKATYALVDKFGSRLYVKWNGWDRKYAQEPNNTDRVYHKILLTVSDRAMVGFEPGWAWAIPDSTSDAMRQSIYDSISKTLDEVPVSYFCLQNKYFEILTTQQLVELSGKFRGIKMQYPPFGAGARPTTAPSPTLTSPPRTLPAEPEPTPVAEETEIPIYREPTAHPVQVDPTTPLLQPTYSAEDVAEEPNMSDSFIPLMVNKRPLTTVFDPRNFICREGISVRTAASYIFELPKNIFNLLVSVDVSVDQFFSKLAEKLPRNLN